MNRATYWLYFIISIAFMVALNIFGSKHVAVGEVILVVLCVPRLHDMGRSGWYVLIGFGIEVLGLIIGFSFFGLDEATAVAGLAVLVIAGLMIWLGCVKGDPNPNQWGDPPPAGLSFRRPNSV